MFLPILVVGFQRVSGLSVIKQVEARLSHVHAISVTLSTSYTNPSRQVKEYFQVLKGGYLRYRQRDSLAIVSPEKAWLVWPNQKRYQPRPAPPKGSAQNPFTGMPGLFGEGRLPAIGWAQETTVGKEPAYLIKMDARKVLPRGSLYFLVSRDKKLPLGFRIVQDKLTIEGVYSDLKLDPPLKPSDFTFTPGKGWTAMPSGGGSKG
ncbi:MAG TPA: hypothetical protein VHE55_09715 [Fimbriimonadaceae bacterium]|nr:hypothetical protein [Fimbriimonadaceae bacterium]